MPPPPPSLSGRINGARLLQRGVSSQQLNVTHPKEHPLKIHEREEVTVLLKEDLIDLEI